MSNVHDVCKRCTKDCKQEYTNWNGCMPDEIYCDKFIFNDKLPISIQVGKITFGKDKKIYLSLEDEDYNYCAILIIQDPLLFDTRILWHKAKSIEIKFE